ncbi:MAG: DUF2089 domain-containing protein [Chitinivibrionales bacterium]
MASAWYELTALTGQKEFVVTSIKMKETGITIQGEFELAPLARLSDEDQVFVAHFIRTHGSIKEMEQAFGVSYPTIKARLNRIGSQLQFVEVVPASKREEILAQLERGEISAKEATEKLAKS